jgi:putative GTP pyrophosphokinase
MENRAIENIIEEYDRKRDFYIEFTEKAEKLIKVLLKEKDIKVHSVTSRAKDKDKLQEKLANNESKYTKLRDVTDLAGVRIICYYSDEVDAVATLLEYEFIINWNLSVDKRTLLDPDRFGYNSLHYIAKFKPSRIKLTEYQRFADYEFEIQIRSILQHAWAEIEHDIGYKSRQSVPSEIRRRFSRLAGLLEVADDEFIQIREKIQEYKKTIAKFIFKKPNMVLIDQASLEMYVTRSVIVDELDRRIAGLTQAKLYPNPAILSHHINQFEYFGMKTIADIEKALVKYRTVILNFVELWGGRATKLSRGICLFYLFYILAARNRSQEEVIIYLRMAHINKEEKRPALANKLISLYNKALRKK